MGNLEKLKRMFEITSARKESCYMNFQSKHKTFLFFRNEVMRQLDIPSRYKVFCVVSLGYPKENAPGRDQMSKRFDMNNVYFNNKFGSSF